MEYNVTNPLTVELLKLFKALSDKGMVYIHCNAESPTMPTKSKWIGFTRLANIGDEDKARIQFLSNVLEPGLWDRITLDTYIPLEDSDFETYPVDAIEIAEERSFFINGEVSSKHVQGYLYNDILYVPSEVFT